MKNLLFASVAIAALVLAGMSFPQFENETKNNKSACSQCVQDTGASCCSQDKVATCCKQAEATCSSGVATCSSGCCSVENSPVILALDLDKDGMISALEIKNAASSLSALDSDGNGNLDASEIHAKSNFSQVNAPATSNAPVMSELQLGVTPDYYIDQLMFRYDDNDNNQLETAEMPASMVSMLEFIDTNDDGIMTEDELRNIRTHN